MNQLLLYQVEAPPIIEFTSQIKNFFHQYSEDINLAQAVPSYPTFKPIRHKMAEAILQQEKISLYSEVPGLLELRKIIYEKHKLKSDTWSHEQVLITAGANHGLFTYLLTCFNPGDEVVLIEPFYFNYDMALKMLGIKALYYQPSPENGFQLNAADFIDWCKGHPRIKGVILISPNNPTGACYQASEILQFCNWATSNDIEIILDETYGKYDALHLNQSDLCKHIGHGLSLVGSFSKTLGMTGYRVGYIILSQTAFQQALKVQDTLVICAPHISQVGVLVGFKECDSYFEQELKGVEEKKRLFLENSTGLKKLKVLSAGAYFSFLEIVSKLRGSELALDFYQKTGIIGLPGNIFGQNQNNRIRLAFCNVDSKTVLEACRRLAEYEKM